MRWWQAARSRPATDGFPVTEELLIALRMLKTRERFPAEIDRKLQQKGFGKAEREAAIGWLERKGLLSERRAVEAIVDFTRARSIKSDAAVMHQIEALGASDEAKSQASGLLMDDDELSRARRLLNARGVPPRTPAASARWLASRGFSEETINALLDLEGDHGG